jgi:hypothetical protein
MALPTTASVLALFGLALKSHLDDERERHGRTRHQAANFAMQCMALKDKVVREQKLTEDIFQVRSDQASVGGRFTVLSPTTKPEKILVTTMNFREEFFLTLPPESLSAEHEGPLKARLANYMQQRLSQKIEETLNGLSTGACNHSEGTANGGEAPVAKPDLDAVADDQGGEPRPKGRSGSAARAAGKRASKPTVVRGGGAAGPRKKSPAGVRGGSLKFPNKPPRLR